MNTEQFKKEVLTLHQKINSLHVTSHPHEETEIRNGIDLLYEQIVGSLEDQGFEKDLEGILSLINSVAIRLENRTETDRFKLNEMSEFDQMRKLLNTKISDLNLYLSSRIQTVLKYAEIKTLAELVSWSPDELLKFKNFGEKSLNELDELLREKGLSFGMGISRYFHEN